MVPKELIEAIPDTSLMPKIGLTGYSLSEMLAELGDNSIDERVEGKPVTIDIDLGPDSIRITDDAQGMTKEALTTAIRLAHSRKKNKLGQYGLGMKAACVAMGDRFTIDTCPVGGAHAYRITWDADEWAKKGAWNFEMETLPAAKGKHGTSILIERLRVKAGGKLATLRVDLGRRFGPFIRRDLAVIRVEGKAVEPPTVDFLDQDGLKVKNPTDLDLPLSDGSHITGWVGLLKHSSQRGHYGFDTFRHGRMITTFDKFGFTAHPTVARVVGELHLDNVPVTANKREWIRESNLYLEGVEKVKKAIAPFLAESRRLAHKQSVEEGPVDRARKEQFKDALAQALSAPELKEFTLPEKRVSDGADKQADRRGQGEAEVPGKEVRDPGTQKGAHKATGEGGQRTPRKVDLTKLRRLRIKGRIFDYKHEWKSLGTDGPWMEKAWDADQRTLEIDSNADNPAVLVTADRTFLAFLHIADAIAQIIMEESGAGWDKFDEIRQVLIREASKHVSELREVPAV